MNRKFVLIILFAFSCIHSCLVGNASEKRRVVFIVNPISHEIKGLDIKKIIEMNLDSNQFEYEILYTQHAQHASKLAQDALVDSADIIAAVGGDGTVNEVGGALIHSEAVLAIIPVGSGNGLARHLGIPVGLKKAINALNNGYSVVIDTATINEKTFLGVAGIGFDAHIAHKFALFGKRGFFSYCQVALEEFPLYVPQSYLITIDGKQITRNAFILTFANSSQYGNNFIIAPKARVSDGYLDLVIIDDIPIDSIPQFLYRFWQGSLNDSRHFETHPFKEITIQHPSIQAHLDGEPLLFENEIKVRIQPKSLKVLVPKK
jgi:YegS/Rv2252/BmrU family lipid kinase